ncbi:Gfo/Idh/MocA family oxidoreductase [Rathayibacter sp. YIM 133350]|uniref:Gfo/Idh/MocA family protein n=1 Tax=Rathayibacter sp. YIM 133350 TaxID=3131992 RepID=UPI00307F0C76
MTTDVMAPASVMRAAFLGGGFMAAVHSRAARAARATLAGAASSSPERAVRAANALGIDRGFDSVEELVSAEGIDVVHVCTPNALHAEMTLAAIAAGKHVICEKPLATSVADAERVVAAAREAGVLGTVPFVYRFHPLVREARDRIARGELGRILSVDGAYLQDWLADPGADDWRVDVASGGPSRAFADIGSHLCDLIEFVSGEPIVRLVASARTVYADRARTENVATEDVVALVVELAGGALGSLLVSQVAQGRKNSLVFELSGTDAAVRFDQEAPDTLWLGGPGASRVLSRGDELSADAARLSLVPPGHPMGYQDAFNAFVADSYAAMRGAEPPDGLPTFEDGLRAVRVTAAVLASVRSGGWVEVAS